jgi:predicted TIM-barrel fold metal-dependent hydrolase
MILDGHIHIDYGNVTSKTFIQRLQKAGVDGGIVLSLHPHGFSPTIQSAPNNERLDNLFRWSNAHPNLYPFYWIDPLEDDAARQVQQAVKRGVMGFKVICNTFYPSNKRALKIFQTIAAAHKPILFHSGILWDGTASSRYNRPVEFEALLEIRNLKFALAHVSWPWCDELIAVYGKFLHAYKARPDVSCEMFVDLTPGTPAIYRKPVLTNLFQVGYDIENNLLFGSDCSANDYEIKAVRGCIRIDSRILKTLGVSQRAIEKLFGDNVRRFVGCSNDSVHGKR